MRLCQILTLTLLVAVVACGSASGAGRSFAPLDRPGPALTLPQATLDAALECRPSVENATRQPVLLSPGTGVSGRENYGFNYIPAFDQAGIPWCTLTMPDHTLGDMQVQSEYLVNAIRTMHRRAGRRIAVLGHSLGGMTMRWPLRFWPDTREMVDDVVGIAGDNHGTTTVDAYGTCVTTCAPAMWQHRDKGNWTIALNSFAETFSGVSYTEIYSHFDEVVQPARDDTGTSSLRTGEGRIANVAVQDLCPANGSEHVQVGTVDAVAYALARDALDHDGPADPARVDPTVCSQAFMPGVDPLAVQANLAPLLAAPALLAVVVPGGVNLAGVPTTDAEPPLRCYVFADCPGAAPSRSCTSRRTFVIHLPRGLRAARVTVAGRRVKVVRGTARVDLRGRPRGTVVVRITGQRADGRSYRTIRRFRPCVRRR